MLAVKDNQLIGYLDVTHCFEENEPCDLFVKPEEQNKGYEKALLARAVELNEPHRMMVLVDVDSAEEIEVFSAVGFEKTDGQNSIYASYRL